VSKNQAVLLTTRIKPNAVRVSIAPIIDRRQEWVRAGQGGAAGKAFDAKFTSLKARIGTLQGNLLVAFISAAPPVRAGVRRIADVRCGAYEVP
jgi:hypothetical protein